MAYVIAAPEMMTAAAAEIATIGSTLDVANAVAALPTVGLAPAAADEVSASIAQLFSEHAREYQAPARQAAAFQDQFVENLMKSSDLYALVEAFNAAFLDETLSLEGEVFTRVIAAMRSTGCNWRSH